MSEELTRIADLLEDYIVLAKESLALSRENQRISILNLESNQQMGALYRQQCEGRMAQQRRADAWLFVCQGPGRQTAFASIDSDPKQTWPQDDWTWIERLPLVVAGDGEVLLDRRESDDDKNRREVGNQPGDE